MKKTVLSALALFVGAMSVGCRKSSTPTSPTSTPPTPSTILLVSVPGTLSLGVGDTTQVRAVATLPDHSTQILTNSATWSSSNASAASVNESGIVTAVGVGSTNITVTAGGISGTTAVTVTATSADARMFLGTVAGPDALSGTLALSLGSLSRGSLYLPNVVISLLGRVDAPTNIVNVSGGGFSFLGTLHDNILSGTYTDPSGVVGGFSTLDATHSAVTAFCGSYTTDSTTPLENPDGGAFNVETSIDGTTSGTSLPADASSAPLVFAGRRDGATLTMVTSRGASLSGTIDNGTATGTFQTAAGGAATFSATTSACH